jgi:hypothetical protein
MYYVLGGIGALLLCLFFAMFPDLVRYMKIRAM